jgi:hypothetical protein
MNNAKQTMSNVQGKSVEVKAVTPYDFCVRSKGLLRRIVAKSPKCAGNLRVDGLAAVRRTPLEIARPVK